MQNTIFPDLYWLIFIVFSLFTVSVDILAHKYKKVFLICIVYAVIFLLSCFFVWHGSNSSYFKLYEFLVGYVIELSLSIDNIFVFILIFDRFNLSNTMQNKVLLFGILGALFMRFFIIIYGVGILNKFELLFFVFGLVLIISGCNILISFFKKNRIKSDQILNIKNDSDIDDYYIVKILKKIRLNIDLNSDDSFFKIKNSSITITKSFIVLLMVEKADLIFAIDSIPAVMSVTNDSFIIFSSNTLAIIILRSIYSTLSKIIKNFEFFHLGLSAVLIFIGVKMCVKLFHIEVENIYSLFFILVALSLPMIPSLFKKRIVKQ